MKQIVKKNVKPSDPDTKLKLTIYYKTKKTRHLLLKNSPPKERESLQKSHLIYRFTCNRESCKFLQSTYIGMTTTRLSRRLTLHLASGAPKKHMQETHGATINRETLVENTEVLTTCDDPRRLAIIEALYIKDMNPSMNQQADDLQALPSARRTGAARKPTEQATPPSTPPASQSRVRTRGLRSREGV